MPDSEYDRGRMAALATPPSVLEALDSLAEAAVDDAATLATLIETFVVGFFAFARFDLGVDPSPDYKSGFTDGLALLYGSRLT
jgi:hypothetical protein